MARRVDVVTGTFRADELKGGPLRDVVLALGGGDRIDAGAGGDIVLAGSGDDVIRAGLGRNVVLGGGGTDTAVYGGSVREAKVVTTGAVTRVTGPGGENDRLLHVEQLLFESDDYTLFLDGRNNAVLAGDDEAATGEDAAIAIAASELLANDAEFDGDALSIVEVAATSAGAAAVRLENGVVTYDPEGAFDRLGAGETATDTFTYTVEDGKGGTDTATVTVTITGVNDAPELALQTEVSVAENTTAVAAGISATDPEGDVLSFALSGTDAEYFAIDSATGALSFLAAPDFEAPADEGADNVYDVTVTVGDGEGGTASRDLAVTVTDENEAPTILPRINEFHYDNAGDDAGEFIEVRVAAGAAVGALSVVLYNGSNGASYRTLPLAGLTPTSDGTYDYYVIDLPSNGIQNGSADGVALVDGEVAVEFLSYEGSFDATDGPAAGQTSKDIGVAEASDTPAGFSLQRVDEEWVAPAPETKGEANAPGTPATDPRINEFHYDDDGVDAGEFIEVRVEAGAAVAGLSVVLYSGSDGGSYGTIDVAGVTATTDGTFDYYVLDVSGLQNGSPDGFALVDGGTVVEFLSYEGAFAAADGPAAGTTSTDIGVSETSSTPAGFSLQRFEDKAWAAPAPETRGVENEAGGGGGEEPEPLPLLISQVQGTGSASFYQTQRVTVDAIVTATISTGFFLQEEDAQADADAATSEGIFVFTGALPTLAAGDRVAVTGTVTEFFGETQIGTVTDIVVVSPGNAFPTATPVQLGPDLAVDWESVEGMLVEVSSATADPLTVTENFEFGRFGEIAISAGNKTQPTQIYDAQTEAAEVEALAEANALNRLVIDDGFGGQNPEEFRYVPASVGDNGNGYFDAGDTFTADGPTLRLGSELTEPATGVISFNFGDYKLIPTEQLAIDPATNAGARTDAPAPVGGDLQVASFNVLNFFTTLGDSGGGSGPDNLDPRGADNAEELARQTAKIVEALLAIDAEVIGLQELENNGFGPDSAIATLVDALNAATAPGTYAFVDPTAPGSDGFIGTDAITTGIIYKPGAVSLVTADVLVYDEATSAQTVALAQPIDEFIGPDLQDLPRNRPTVAATFANLGTGAEFTVAVSHFKSKNDSGLASFAEAAQSYLDGGGDRFTQADLDAFRADGNFDQGDGQAFWNAVREEAAEDLVAWLETDYAGGGVENYLIIGDLNAYAEEDPVQAIRAEGNVDLIDAFLGQEEAYSFVFDGQRGTLDQALASGSLADNVTGLAEWHINADEPGLLSYDTSFTDARFYNPDDPFAASDHDPVIIGLDFGNGQLLV